MKFIYLYLTDINSYQDLINFLSSHSDYSLVLLCNIISNYIRKFDQIILSSAINQIIIDSIILYSEIYKIPLNFIKLNQSFNLSSFINDFYNSDFDYINNFIGFCLKNNYFS